MYHILQKEGAGLQSPHAPFEVAIKYRVQPIPQSYESVDQQQALFGNLQSQEYTRFSGELGAGQLSEGIEEGVTFMSKGEHAFILMQGQRIGMDKDKWYVVDIVLESFMEVRNMTGDGGVLKRRVKEGKGEFPIDAPLRDCKITCHVKCKNQGEENWRYDSRETGQGPWSFHTGEGEAPEGLEMCLKLMLRGEISLLTCNPQWGYSGRLDVPQGIDSEQSVQFEIEMIDFEHDGHVEIMDIEQKLAFIQKLKDQGNVLLKQGKHRFAKTRYERAWQVLKQSRDIETEDQVQQSDTLKQAVLSNLALCCFHMEEFAESISWCNQVLEIDANNVKALLRRGRARTGKGDYELAEEDYDLVSKLDSDMQQEIEYSKRLNKQKKMEAIKKQKNSFGKF
eukprot:TRINITY_DN6700_c0_g1_i1.p1 TRINITY_DN6700_c0_g1~~TRINITY_DN6700_c0_g1_i1.p1  ORF type:complete len:394 (-),score=46.33 TRINITY_DN6700_c0_g1_i1:200-1381(-)